VGVCGCVCVCVPVPPPLTEERPDRPRAPLPARAALSWPPGGITYAARRREAPGRTALAPTSLGLLFRHATPARACTRYAPIGRGICCHKLQ
jgi:hypothetical protein